MNRGRTLSRRAALSTGVGMLGALLVDRKAFALQGEQRRMAKEPINSALLVLDYQVGIGDKEYARTSATRVVSALAAGRKAGLLIIFSKVKFRPGYADIASSNKVFARFKRENLLPPDASKLIPLFQPAPGELVVDKDRFSAFSGNDLTELLRSAKINHLVLAGVATSGVVLSTYTAAADKDYAMTVLSDACADPKPTLHHELMTDLFPTSATVATVDEWSAHLGAEQPS